MCNRNLKIVYTANYILISYRYSYIIRVFSVFTVTLTIIVSYNLPYNIYLYYVLVWNYLLLIYTYIKYQRLFILHCTALFV